MHPSMKKAAPLIIRQREAVTSFRRRSMSISTPPQIVIDDNFLCEGSVSNNCFTFGGESLGGPTFGTLDQTLHIADGSWSVSFSGTAINVFGTSICNGSVCRFDLQVDGGPATHESSPSWDANILQLTANQLGSQSPNHTLRVSNMSDPSANIDYAIVDAPLDTELLGKSAGQLWVDIHNTAITYHGAWHKVLNDNSGAEGMQSNTVGDSLSFDFIGDSIVVLGQADTSVQGSVSLDVTVDNGAPSPQGFISDPHTDSNCNSSLAQAQHHVEIKVTAVTKSQVFDFRGMLYHSSGNTLGDAIASNATASSTTSSQGTLLPSTTSSLLRSPSHSSALNQKSHPSIAGPVAGSVAGAVLLVAFLLIIWVRRRRQRALSVEPITPFQQAPGMRSAKRLFPSAPPAVVPSGVSGGADPPPAAQEEPGASGILRALVARVDALATERGPPPYVG
ncbi:hypothetical protein C8R46DRAFT_1295346 [Mycena filopes]|nr:hypothetical protein C8R46DRAFT_1295346 [Mycena filopes]